MTELERPSHKSLVRISVNTLTQGLTIAVYPRVVPGLLGPDMSLLLWGPILPRRHPVLTIEIRSGMGQWD